MAYRLLAIAITLFWLAMTTSLIRDRVWPDYQQRRSSLVDPNALAVNWFDIHEWSWVRRQGETIGAMVLSVEQKRVPEDELPGSDGYRVIQNGAGRVQLPIPLLGALPREIILRMSMDLDSHFRIDRFIAQLASGELSIQVVGFVEGSRLYYRVHPPAPAPPQYGYFQLKYPPSLLSSVESMMPRHFDLEEGESYSIQVMDPILGLAQGEAEVLVSGRETIQIDGENIETWRLATRLGGTVRNSWVDMRRQTVRREILRGYVLDRAAKSAVLEDWPVLNGVLEIPDYDRESFIEAARAAGETEIPSGAGLSALSAAGGFGAKGNP